MRRNSDRHGSWNTKRTVEDGAMLLAGIGAGLAAMYLLDPKQGRERRERAVRAAGEAMGTAWNHASDTAGNLASKLKDRGSEVAGNLAEQARDYVPEALRPEPEHHYVAQSACAVGSMLLGAGLTYLLDPQLGRERRGRLLDGAATAVRDTADFFVCAFHWAADRIHGEPSGSETYAQSDQTRTSPMSESASSQI